MISEYSEVIASARDVVLAYAGRGIGRKPKVAVDGVSFDIRAGETVALVGETGCGKSSLARLVVGLERPTQGEIWIRGTGEERSRSGQRKSRGRVAQLIFQDPFDSLNPRKSVYQTLRQPLLRYGVVSRGELRGEMLRLLDAVGLGKDPTVLDRAPHQFSGGQRQRVVIARALAVRPRLIVADEPVSALDVSIRAQILRLLSGLQRSNGLSYLFITHDLRVAEAIADRVLVMYGGKIVEEGMNRVVFASPKHPYTAALLASSPNISRVGYGAVGTLSVSIRSASENAESEDGCRYRASCVFALEQCACLPPWLEVEEGHWTRCHFPSVLAEGES